MAFLKSLKWLLAIPLLFLLVLYFVQNREGSRKGLLPPIVTLPPFQLADQDGLFFSRENFLGKVSVVNFIFTHCPTVCPLLTQKMKSLSLEVADPQVQFISISVDPENDTSAVLKAYANQYGVDLNRWKFLTGPLETISKTVVEGFKVVMIRNEAKDLFDITHGEHFILIDKKASIRAYRLLENPTDQKEMIQLIKALSSE